MAARRTTKVERVERVERVEEPRRELGGAGVALAIGVLLFLAGVYGMLRIYHITARGVPYPATGVLPSNVLFDRGPFYYSRETDCKAYTLVYYELDGKTVRQASEEEKTVSGRNEARCVQGFYEDRQKQLQYDRNLSAFLIFVGGGLITAVKYWRLF
ncbi:MAG: hypothetical protein Q7S79_01315 [bacterium]|nr:hypothetical protein [bacterium]